MTSPARTPATGTFVVADEHLARALRGEDALVFDGAMGTALQARGLAESGMPLSLACLADPDDVTDVHAAYAEAGAEVATANTFGANARALQGRASVAEVFRAAVACARRAGARYVAGDIGPAGIIADLGVVGDAAVDARALEEAYALFAEQVDAARDAGCDLVLVETMYDLREARLALLAARARCRLPVFVTCTLAEDGCTYLGTAPEMAAAALASFGAHAVGANCSYGPDKLLRPVRAMARSASRPLLVQPNAGLPRDEGGRVVYEVDADAFACALEPLVDAGATMVGGCCGTTPAHIARVRQLMDERFG